MSCTRNDDGDETVITLAGSLDAATAADAIEVFHAVVDDKRQHVTIDASELTNLEQGPGVAALAVLIRGVGLYGGSVHMAGTTDQPRAILRLLRLDKWMR